MKLIAESTLLEDMKILSEGKGSNKRMYITGPFLQAVKENRNGRIYPQTVMDGAVNKYKEEYIDKKRALGELNHPAEPVVNPERAAIMTESLEKNDIYYVGKAKVLSTPMGKIVESLVNDGCTVGVSSRGLGSLKPTREGYNEVQGDFILTTAADIVFDPSAQTSFVEGVFEQAEWIYESGVFVIQDLDIERNKLLHAKKSNLNEVKLNMFNKFLRDL
jgi:hypothetical protein|tara:strand:- start:6543 stop:7196 length:654 start_codon:yes stop_codon:yes gene_type:complete